MSSEIQRWAQDYRQDWCPHDEGQWVKFSDHERVVAELQALAAGLREECEKRGLPVAAHVLARHCSSNGEFRGALDQRNKETERERARWHERIEQLRAKVKARNTEGSAFDRAAADLVDGALASLLSDTQGDTTSGGETEAREDWVEFNIFGSPASSEGKVER